MEIGGGPQPLVYINHSFTLTTRLLLTLDLKRITCVTYKRCPCEAKIPVYWNVHPCNSDKNNLKFQQ
jgi:hypothetical protein